MRRHARSGWTPRFTNVSKCTSRLAGRDFGGRVDAVAAGQRKWGQISFTVATAASSRSARQSWHRRRSVGPGGELSRRSLSVSLRRVRWNCGGSCVARQRWSTSPRATTWRPRRRDNAALIGFAELPFDASLVEVAGCSQQRSASSRPIGRVTRIQARCEATASCGGSRTTSFHHLPRSDFALTPADSLPRWWTSGASRVHRVIHSCG